LRRGSDSPAPFATAMSQDDEDGVRPSDRKGCDVKQDETVPRKGAAK
jgi:hypothetical protein